MALALEPRPVFAQRVSVLREVVRVAVSSLLMVWMVRLLARLLQVAGKCKSLADCRGMGGLLMAVKLVLQYPDRVLLCRGRLVRWESSRRRRSLAGCWQSGLVLTLTGEVVYRGRDLQRRVVERRDRRLGPADQEELGVIRHQHLRLRHLEPSLAWTTQ